ncbi:hypothetical protein C7999DRAFT_33025 [Corynascus novoguineensis]|uniref:Secreted protein n=1 Tax=Corynascus novoguineensis TaxID=1126955 RepID=A0AAN7CTJ2_9PEZI|nr:hypothetical protein C7999DRAFT_33025 [Corynascus novoguineensis]
MSFLQRVIRVLVLALQFVAFAAALPNSISRGQDSSPGASPGRQPIARRTVIGGHGVVMLPGKAPIETDGQDSAIVKIGSSNYRVVAGIDTVIDGVPVKDYTPVDGDNDVDEPAEPVSAGQAAAIAFAEAAERLQKEREQQSVKSDG